MEASSYWSTGIADEALTREPPGLSDELKNLHPSLRSTTLSVKRAEDNEPTSAPSSLTLERASKREVLTTSASNSRSISDLDRYDVKELDDASERDILGDRPDASIVGCSLTHFLPSQFAVHTMLLSRDCGAS